jgi:hypothetical protein
MVLLSVREEVDEVGAELRGVWELKRLGLKRILIVCRERQVSSIVQLVYALQVWIIEQVKVLIVGLHGALLEALTSGTSLAPTRYLACL